LTGLDNKDEQFIIEPKQVDCDVLLLLATSGMGKTRAIFKFYPFKGKKFG
jgi:hypothetical protein